jgi:hypothetical protein
MKPEDVHRLLHSDSYIARKELTDRQVCPYKFIPKDEKRASDGISSFSNGSNWNGYNACAVFVN